MTPGTMVRIRGTYAISVMQSVVPDHGVEPSSPTVGMLGRSEVAIVLAAQQWRAMGEDRLKGQNLLVLCPTCIGWMLSFWVEVIK